ncbi:MAG: DnaJ C-terminal domain-containing protein [Microcystis panniformis]
MEAKLTLPLEKAYQGGRQRIRLEDGRSIEVDMPAAMIDGQKIRLKGQGIEGGDLYLKITIARHPFFKIQGSDIVCHLDRLSLKVKLILLPHLDELNGERRQF